MGPGLCSALSEEAAALPLAGLADAFDGVGVDFLLSGEGGEEAASGEEVDLCLSDDEGAALGEGVCCSSLGLVEPAGLDGELGLLG